MVAAATGDNSHAEPSNLIAKKGGGVLVYEGFGLLLVVALWIFCLVDVIVSKEDECRNLPKLLWLLIVLMLPDVGSLLWLIVGRPRGQRQQWPRGRSQQWPGGRSQQWPGGRRESWQQRTAHPATGPRPKMAPRPTMPSAGANPDDDDEFLRSIRRTDE
jgi:hypothetical protein